MEKAHRIGEVAEAPASLTEGLDDLYAAHILHQSGVHFVAGAQIGGHFFSVSMHHPDHEDETYRHGDKTGKPHAPVHGEDQRDAQQRRGKIRGELRHHVGDDVLQTAHVVHQQGLKGPRRGFQHDAHGNPGHLVRQGEADVFEDGEGYAMAAHARSAREPCPQTHAQRCAQGDQRRALYRGRPLQQLPGQERHGKVGRHAEYLSDQRQQDRQRHAPFGLSRKGEEGPEGILFVRFQRLHLTIR